MGVAIISGLFALAGAFLGVFFQRKTQHQTWLLEQRSETFGEFLRTLEVSRRNATEIMHAVKDKGASKEIKILDAYEPTFILSKVVRLYLAKETKDEFSKLVKEVWALHSQTSFGDNRFKKLEEKVERIQQIFEENLEQSSLRLR